VDLALVTLYTALSGAIYQKYFKTSHSYTFRNWQTPFDLFRIMMRQLFIITFMVNRNIYLFCNN